MYEMWLISQSSNQEERYMLPEEHLLAIPQFAECAGQEPFPHIRCPLTGTQKKWRENASRLDLADIVVLSARLGVVHLKGSS